MPRINDLQSFTDAHWKQIIFQCISGSHAYGTAHEQSDEDVRGVIVEPARSYFGYSQPEAQHADAKNDIVFYTLHRLLELVATANPNMIELLYMPREVIQICSPLMERVIAARQSFITKRAYESHVGYAHTQIKRARGQNKWVNNPQPKALPLKEDFCWFIPRHDEGDAMPMRPIPLAESGVKLGECHASALEHAPSMYRLYHYGESARGVFRKEMLVTEAIPLEDERPRCIGVLIFNQQAYERAAKNHRHYWAWREERNERRWLTQESGEMDYDAKNMMHTFRLLLSGEHILREGEPLVRFEGQKLAFLKSVLQGERDYDELIDMAEAKTIELETLCKASSLPDQPEPGLAERLLRDVTAEWEASIGAEQ